MLTQVPTAVNAAVRTVVLRHPNSMVCSVWRKSVTRVEIDPTTGGESQASGMPTLGGMTVLSAEDEDQISYTELGEARVLFCGVHQAADMVDNDNGIVPATLQEAQVVAVADPGTAAHFEADKGDLVAVLPGMGLVLAYSVEGVVGTGAIPGYVRKLVLSPRDELNQMEPYQDGAVDAVE